MSCYRSIVFSFLFFFSLSFPSYAQTMLDHSKWDHLLKSYVKDGLIDYEGLAKNRALLDDYINELESFPAGAFSQLSRENRMAFWLNLYNANVIRFILDEHPVKSTEEIPAFFEVRKIKVIGEFFSLNELRDNVLINGFHDERVLTALVSGRMDSPKMMAEAFQGDLLEQQLNETAFQFVSNPSKNLLDPTQKKIYLSPIFQKYSSDFLFNFGASKDTPFSDSEASVVSFLLHHLKDPAKRIYLDSARYKIKYLPEDPRLNAVSNGRISS